MTRPQAPCQLRSRSDYLAALDELDALLVADPDTPAGRRFDELVTLIECWEARHDSGDDPPPLRISRPG